MLNYGLERKEEGEGVNPWLQSNNPQFFLVCFSAK